MNEHEDTFVVEQERDWVDGRAIAVVIVVGLIVFVIAVLVSLEIFQRGPREPRGADAVAPPQISGIEQTVFLASGSEIDNQRRAQEELTRWSFRDRDAGVATIPVDVAMRIVAGDAGEKR